MSDNRFLLRQRQGWWAVVEVPPSLRQTLGRRLKRTLKTRDVAVARARRWAVVASLKGQIERARKAQQGDPLVTEALAWRGYLEAADDSADGGYSTADATRDAIATRVEELYHQGNPRWQELRDIAAGAATPVSLHGLAQRSASVAIARVVALRSYWTWLEARGHLPEDARNPWQGLGPKVRAGGSGVSGEKERAFTAREVGLLVSRATGLLRDFILAGALSGMRREELGKLRVKDTVGGVFVIRSGKSEAAARRVPIHSGLAPTVERLAEGKSPDAWLFDLPGEGKRYGDRTEAIGKQFMRHRRACGLQDGEARRSLLNFHSLRRAFITLAINAASPPIWCPWW